MNATDGSTREPVRKEEPPNRIFLGPAEAVGKRPDSAVTALTLAAIAGNTDKVEPVRQDDLKLVLDYMTFLEMKAALVDYVAEQSEKLPPFCRAIAAKGTNQWTVNEQ
jgi:hypothetical protein